MSKSSSICNDHIYDAIYREHAQKLRNFLYYRCGDLDQANDLTQEAFLRLWNKCAEVIAETVAGFLFTAARNLFLDQKRSEKVSLKFEKSQVSKVNQEDPFFQLRTKEFQAKIDDTIAQLPEKQREAFLMNRIDKMTYKEIALTLRISQTAVEKRVAKALVALKGAIDELKGYKI